MHRLTKLGNSKIATSFRVGDYVKSEYYPEDSNVTRIITKIERNTDTGSTVRIWASDGGTCTCCKRPISRKIEAVDGAWFLPISV